jgi:hypothetical protein
MGDSQSELTNALELSRRHAHYFETTEFRSESELMWDRRRLAKES